VSDVDAVWPGGADGADDGVEGWDLPFDGGLREAYDLMNDENFAGLETHEEMLSDRVRVEAYHRGIHRHVAKGDVVVDLGTGTGLLAFMASRAGAKTVYAVEHSDFIDLAREIADYNGFTNIEFVRANSREFTPPEPIDVVLHEQMGDELFNENMLENVLDLRDRALAPSGRILPSRFRLFVEPILDAGRHADPSILEHRPTGRHRPQLREQSPVAARFNAYRNEEFWLRPHSVQATIGRPQPILEFDLNTIEHPDELPLRRRVERTATADTIVDGCCVWFEACFDNDTTLSTSPLGPVTSWGNRVFRLDQQIARGETLRLDVSLGDLVEPSTWRVRAL
jgi:protein arginine N-methyltransferase 1